MRLDDYDFKNISELYLEDLIYILHPSWALSQLEWDETLGSKYSTSAYCSFGCNGNLISHLKNGQCVFVKSFSTLQEIFGVLDHNGYPRWDLPFFLKARLESLIEGSIKRPATGGYYPNSELLEGNNQQSGLIVGGVQAGARTVVEKKYTEINSPTIEEMLANPEFDGINSVALHPYEKIAEIAADGIEGIGEAFSAAIDGDLQDAALIVLESALEIAGRKVKGLGKLGVVGRTKYHKRTITENDQLRKEFNGVKPTFIRFYSETPEAKKRFTPQELAKMTKGGKLPKDFIIHHKLPLFRGGDNAFNNFRVMNKKFHMRFNKRLHWYDEGKNIYE